MSLGNESGLVEVKRVYIYVDESGKEISRKPVGKGRPPKNAVKQANGDFVVTVQSPKE
jgi:hypothetical protein